VDTDSVATSAIKYPTPSLVSNTCLPTL
jgi:hypothetical protein